MRLWFGAGAVTVTAVVVACVGSDAVTDSVPPSDGGVGTSSSSSSGNTSSSSGNTSSSSSGSPTDAGGDAAGPACDLTKPFDPKTPVPGLTEGQGATLTADEKTLFYTDFSGSFGGGADIAVVTRGDRADSFGNPASAGLFNGGESEEEPSVSAEGNVLVYLGVYSDGYRLHRAYRQDGGFGAADEPPALIIGSFNASPYVGPNGAWLYFSGNNGGPDHIYRTDAVSDGGFTSPVVLAELEYLASGESSPVLSPDEKTIYWSSPRNDLGGDGATGDIYMATRTAKDQKFANLKRISELSTNDQNEGPSWLSPDGCRLYFTSQNPSTFVAHLYVASRGR